ncbi:hypothetical protein ACLKA6_003277 [Drosophila palustris]
MLPHYELKTSVDNREPAIAKGLHIPKDCVLRTGSPSAVVPGDLPFAKSSVKQRTPPQQPLEKASLNELEREWPTTFVDAMHQIAEAKWRRANDAVTSNVDVKDAPRTGRPIVLETDKIVEIFEVDRHMSTRSIGQELGIDLKTVWNHLQKIGYQKKLDVWVPHELTQKKLLDRINACDALLKRNELDPFLKRMVTGDKEWITYDNVKRKRSRSKRSEPAQTITKLRLTARKVLLCVWWDWKGLDLKGIRQLIRSGQNWSIGMVLCSTRSSDGMSYRTHLLVRT